MQDHTFAFIVSAVGIVGALAGIVIGHFLTRSSQHRQWIRDNRKQEYRELLSSISDAYLHIVQIKPGLGWEKEAYLRTEQVKADSFRVLHDRIFIAQEIKDADIMPLWLWVINLEKFPGKSEESQKEFMSLTAKLVEMALNDPNDFGWLTRLKAWMDKNGVA